MRRFLAVAVLLLLSASLAMAAGSKDTGATSTAQKKPVIVYIYNPGTATYPNAWDDIRNYIIEKSGVDFKERFVQTREEYDAQLNVALAGQQDIDLIMVSSVGSMVDFMGRGALAKLNTAVDTYGPDLRKTIQAETWKTVTDADGNIWAIPRQNDFRPAPTLTVRGDWLKKLGLAMPTTIAEFENYMRKALAADFDGNGKPDTVGIIGRRTGFVDFNSTVLWWYTETNGEPNATTFNNYLDAQGRVTPNILHPGYKTYLGKLREWYAEGLIYKEQYTVTQDQALDQVIANKVASYTGWHSVVLSGWEPLLKTVPDSSYDIAFIKTATGKPFASQMGNPGSPHLGVTSYSPVVNEAVKLSAWFVANPTNHTTMVFGVPNKHWRWIDESKLVAERMVEGIDCAFCIGSHTLFNVRGPNETWQRGHWWGNQDVLKGTPHWYPPDWFVPYNFRGTVIDGKAVDAYTLIEEARTGIILGRRPVDDWDTVTAQFRRMYGDDYIRLATEQYNKFK
jgi:ABC-type glycerol-3-phosphate transport system substrate-binding protein